MIDQFLEYLEIEKNCSKLTIRDYRHYLDVFNQWLSSTLPSKKIADLDLAKNTAISIKKIHDDGRMVRTLSISLELIGSTLKNSAI